MHSISQQKPPGLSERVFRRRDGLLWLGVTAVCLLSAAHAVWGALPWSGARHQWSEAAPLLAGPPVWAALAFLCSQCVHQAHRLQIGILGWTTAVAGLHLLYANRLAPSGSGFYRNSLYLWAALWTAFFVLYLWHQPFLVANRLSARQWWKLSGGAFSVVGIAFWAWPFLAHPLEEIGLVLFAGAVALFAVGFSFSIFAYLERLGAGISDWPLRRFIGTALHAAAVILMIGSMAASVLHATPPIIHEAAAAALATGAGAACLTRVAAIEWRYHRGAARAEG